MLGHATYLMGLFLLATFVGSLDVTGARETLVVIGLIGLWRYSWAALNFARAIWFRTVVYPKRKARAHLNYRLRSHPARAHFLITSYKIPTEVTQRVYQSLFAAAQASAGGANVVASVVDRSDAQLVQALFERQCAQDPNVTLTIDRIPGTGKRDALASALRLIAKACPTHDDIVVLVDGDSCVPRDIVAQTAPFFTNENLGALTTDEAVDIAQPGLFRDWFGLRFDQRQIMMCSMGLSNRVLTLTGRMSVFRGDLAINPGFIKMIQEDFITHWRFGRLKFLTGDDKSSWFWLLRQGYEMAYLPDVQSLSLESQPKPGFLDSATTLMVRWFGNMLRTNTRALSLPRQRIGGFVWWSILDQRLSIWTTLAGPLAAVVASVLYDPIILLAYLIWVLTTRYLLCAALAVFRGRWFPISHPFLLYFSQLFGACIKSYVSFRLDRQKWTRQGTRLAMDSGSKTTGTQAQKFVSTYLHALTLGWLLLGIFYLVSGA